ncbi:MAG: DUF1624 domain-containing protein [Candidatus Aminicenantes bacterium]|nr:DUF1624 domain-containing protein [Candidatus Aminicenantes bacterium]
MKWSEWRSDSDAPVPRVDAVDLFRFWVLFFMIQGHLFRAYLLPVIRQQPWFRLHEVLHGFVAPGFLFAAGFAAFLSFHNKRQNYLRLDRAFVLRLRRILFVIAVGYWIHLPFLSLRKTLRFLLLGQADRFYQVDILQCIGSGLLLFTLLAVLLKEERVVAALTALLGALFFLMPGAVQGIRLHPAVDPYFHRELSLFPLFPWVGFLCLGVVAAFVYSRLRKEIFFRLLLLAGIAVFPWVFLLSGKAHSQIVAWSGMMNRAGGVFLLLCLSHWLLNKFGGRFLSLLIRAGSESLFVYVLHLFVIFHSLFGRGLNPLFQDSLSVLEALLLFLAVQLAVFALALLYGGLKKRHPQAWRWAFRLFWVGFFILFALRPH